MPTYHVLFDDHTGTTTLIQLWAETQEQAIQHARGQAIALAKQADHPGIPGEVREAKEVAP